MTWLVLVLALLAPALAEAASYTFTTTAPQETILTRMRTELNVGRVAEGKAPWADNQAMLLDYMTQWVTSWNQSQKDEDAATACTAYQALSAGNKSTITGLLGGRSPCK